MKKLIFAALVVLSTGVLSAFTVKNDTTVATTTKHDTVTDRKEFGTADSKQTAPKKSNPTNDRKEFGTAD